MPRGHPLSKEELALRVRARSHIRYQTQKQEYAKATLQIKIDRRFVLAHAQGKTVIHWTVEQEQQLLNEYKHFCSYCDQQADELELTTNDPNSDFCIENMLPICYPCLINKYTVTLVPLQVAIFTPILDLPDGYNKERLLMLCVRPQVSVHVVARLRKTYWEATIGLPPSILQIKPKYRNEFRRLHALQCTAQLVKFYGERLFEVEARSLFPQYKTVAYYSIIKIR